MPGMGQGLGCFLGTGNDLDALRDLVWGTSVV